MVGSEERVKALEIHKGYTYLETTDKFVAFEVEFILLFLRQAPRAGTGRIASNRRQL